MRVQIASDIHLEFMGPTDQRDLHSTFKGEADVLVLAGDIVPLRIIDQVRDSLAEFCGKYKHVVYVLGNHEYYDTSPAEAHAVLGAVSNELYNLHVLKNSFLMIDGQKFYGGTLWFEDKPRNRFLKRHLNDFYLIKDFEPWVYQQNHEFVANGKMFIDEGTIVVSHHLPSYKSVADRYKGDELNAFFVHDAEHLIFGKKPKLWVHGHSHISCDYRLDQTRVIANPYGYVHELTDFPPELILDV